MIKNMRTATSQLLLHSTWTTALALGLLLAARIPAADIVWTNTVNGNWTAVTNWASNLVPGASDRAWITNSGTYTVTLDATTTVSGLTLGGLSGVQTFKLQGPNKLTLTGAGLGKTTNAVFQLNGGTFDGPGNLILSGPLFWAAGTVTGTGLLQFGGVSKITVGGDAHLSGRTFVNAGVLNWISGSLNTGSGSIISNAPGAVFVISNDVSTFKEGTNGRGLFLNAGVLRKSAGAGGGAVSGIDDVFYNTGLVEVQDGNLFFNAGGTNSGTNQVWAGATLGFGGGTNILDASSIITGQGNLLFQQSLTEINSLYTLTGTNTLKWYGRATFRRPGLALNVLDVNGVDVEVNFLTGSEVAIQTLKLGGGLVGGNDDLTIAGSAVLWNGGGFQGAGRVQCNVGVIMNGASRMDLQGRTIINLGTFTWNDGMLYTALGAVLSNAPGATFVIGDAVGGTLSGTLPRGTIANAGLMQKMGVGSQMTYFSDLLINYGTLEVQGGWLRCWQPYTNAAGQTRLFAGSTFEARATCQITGGTLTGDGLVVGDVFNSGIVSPGRPVGQLTIDGDYTQTAAGVLAIDLGGVTANLYDRLQITNTGHSASLAGTVRAVLTNNFMPAVNDVFTFLTVLPGTRTGTFASFAHPTYLGMTLEYAASTAFMRVTNIAPVPLLAAPGSAWHYEGTDFEGNGIWRLYPQLTWPSMAGAEYYVLHTTNVASTNWSAWPTSGPPFNQPTYITATGAVTTVEGPSIGTRIHWRFPPDITQTVEPAHFYRIQFKP
jgi:fibronectin-binding autotransporter adhesin